MHPYGCHSLSPLYLPSINNHLHESLPTKTKYNDEYLAMYFSQVNIIFLRKVLSIIKI